MAKQHLALPGVGKEDEDVAITDLGGEKQHLREQFFINLASTGIDLIWGLRDRIHFWTGDGLMADSWWPPHRFTPCLQSMQSMGACSSNSPMVRGPQDFKSPACPAGGFPSC